MKLHLDPAQFDQLQMRLLEEIVIAIRDGLRNVGVNDDQTLFEATSEIAFSVAAIIDGSQIMQCDGTPLIPRLTFAQTRDNDVLIAAEGGSWMHETAFGVVEDLFESESE